MLPYQFPSCPNPGSALSTAGSGRGAEAARLPSEGLLSSPTQLGLTPGSRDTGTCWHTRQSSVAGALASCSQIAKGKKTTTKTVGFLQHRQGHLAVSLHLEICSECLNEEPCPDFEPLSTQSQDARQARSRCIITHPTEGSSRGHALLQPPTDVRQLWGSRIPPRHGLQPKHSVLQSCRTLGQSPCYGTSSLETYLPCYVLAQLSPIQQRCLLASKPESQQKKSAAFSHLHFLQ